MQRRRGRHAVVAPLMICLAVAGITGSTATPAPDPNPMTGYAVGQRLGDDLALTSTSKPRRKQLRKRTVRRGDASQVQVLDRRGRVVATFTKGARTVTVRGPLRTFSEPGTTNATVTHRWWVRVLPAAFEGSVDTAWLRRARNDTTPDVLAAAMQYVTGQPTRWDGAGNLLSSDADYGPLQPDGTRQEGSDFHDYLGVSWDYGDRSDTPQSEQLNALDCSGFVRLVFGFRFGVPLTLEPDGARLPRRSFQMLASAPGVVTAPDSTDVPSPSSIRPGDLLFFDASTDDGATVDHVAIYLGVDDAGAPRFVSSRKSVNGPTMGDVNGLSSLSGTGLYARTWRAARRL